MIERLRRIIEMEEKIRLEKRLKKQSQIANKFFNQKKIPIKPKLDSSGIEILNKEEKICRVCYEGICYENNILISPCKCNGSIKYVHENCLKCFFISNNVDVKTAKCQICKSVYNIFFKSVYQFSPEKTCESLKRFFYSIFLLSLIMTLILIIINSLVAL